MRLQLVGLPHTDPVSTGILVRRGVKRGAGLKLQLAIRHEPQRRVPRSGATLYLQFYPIGEIAATLGCPLWPSKCVTTCTKKRIQSLLQAGMRAELQSRHRASLISEAGGEPATCNKIWSAQQVLLQACARVDRMFPGFLCALVTKNVRSPEALGSCLRPPIFGTGGTSCVDGPTSPEFRG